MRFYAAISRVANAPRPLAPPPAASGGITGGGLAGPGETTSPGRTRWSPSLITSSPSSSPLVTTAATTATTPGSSVASNALELGVLGAPQTNLSVQGTIADSVGPPVPQFDPALVGQLNWNHQTTPESNPFVAGTSSLITNTGTANAGYQQAFSTGTLVNIGFDNSHQSLNSTRSSLSPFTSSTFGITVSKS